MPVPYRLAVIDLDDTLLGHDKKVSPENRAALDRLRALGIEIAIASGRQHDNIALYAEQIGPMGWIISSQGAMVRHLGVAQPVYDLTLPLPLALEVYQKGIDRGITLIGYRRDGIFAEVENEWTRLYTQRAGQSPRQGNLRELAHTGLQKLLWMSAGSTLAPMVNEMEEFYRGRLCVVQTEKEHLEFLPVEATKALGAETVANELHITRDQVIAFGDGNNDVPILEWAGMSVAMAHGKEIARHAAKKVTPPGPPDTAFARGVAMVLG